MKRLNNERGLTLIELLATIVLISMIGLVAFGILFNGFKTYDRVKVETALRDEADIIMAELISHMYTMKSSDIASKHLTENEQMNYYLQLHDGGKVGFFEGKLHLKDKTNLALQSDQIRLAEETKIYEISDGQFRIVLSLEWTSTGQKLTIESEVGIVKDG